MRKIKLDLDQLNVESFSTTGRKAPKRGTVHGREWTDLESCWGGCETVSGVVECECQPITFGGDTCYFCESAECELQTAESSPDICP